MHRDVPSLHTFIVELILIEEFFFPFLEFMVSRITTSNGPQIAQVNEEPPLESSLNLTLTQHPRDENLEPQCALILKLNPFKLGIIAFFQTLTP